MNVYIYAADIYCEDCGEAIRKQITQEGHAPADPGDEWGYDSDEFPKGPYPDGGGESDTPQHCGAGEDCLNAIKLADGHKIGAWLENDLTCEGAEAAYILNALGRHYSLTAHEDGAFTVTGDGLASLTFAPDTSSASITDTSTNNKVERMSQNQPSDSCRRPE